jgi:hypothetical protein
VGGFAVTSLGSLQRALSDAIRSTATRREAGVSARAANLVVPGVRGVQPAERLEIYREQFWVRHLSNLEEDYPTLRWVVGASAFRELASDCLQAFPPRTWNLERLGQDVPSFVEGRPVPQLGLDAARLDWAFMEAFAAADVPPFDPKVLAEVPEDAWPGARIVFHPSLRPLALSHPVHSLREAIQRGDSPERPAPEVTWAVVWRDPACYLKAVAIDEPAFELLSSLRAGAALGVACERLAAGGRAPTDGVPLERRISLWFQQWTASAWLSSVRLG